MTLLKTNGLTLKRGEKLLFSSLDLSIRHGSVTAVIGPNGAGKSSLLMTLAGVLQPSSGSCLIKGVDVQTLPRSEVASLMAWQGELPPTEFGLSVEQRLYLAAGNQADTAAFSHALESMELDALMPGNLGELSSGERQRVEIASVMVRDCPVWLFDEPTAHLDLQHQVACLNMIRKQSVAGRAIITVLHDIQQAAAVADQVVMLDGQGGIESGDVGAIMNRKRLELLFGVKLTTIVDHEYTAFLPDYRVDG